jgi:hypothetical protein
MPDQLTRPEALVLDVLFMADILSMDELIQKLPELSWNELFLAVDRLSRRGAISLRRHGFDYELSLPHMAAAAG